MSAETMDEQLFFEDFPAGEVAEYGGLDVSADAIVEFAREFDPQPFHLDPEAPLAPTGGSSPPAGTPARSSCG